MKVCKQLCPVHKVQRCCFLCNEREGCKEVCPEDGNSLCELLIDVPDGDAEALAEPIMQRLTAVLKQKAALEEEEKKLKEALKAHMEQYNSQSFKGNKYMKVTYIAGTETTVFNTDLFKKSCPDIYAQYTNKPKKTSAYIKCELVKDKKG